VDPKVETARRERSEAAMARILAADPRDHLNVVFIGHVDAGKSTLGGRILHATGNVDDRTIEKFEKEAKDKGRDSWYMAYIMDTNEEERAKGKTVEVGRAHFATEKRRYTVLDAPGHKNYVPNMISGATQADLGVLVISARRGEFEAGFERGGQTREHAQLAKTLGVERLICVVNKMDDPSFRDEGHGGWSRDRFRAIRDKMSPFLKGCGYGPKDTSWVPISALSGENVSVGVDPKSCPWWEMERAVLGKDGVGGGGPQEATLFNLLDATEPAKRDPLGGFRMPIMDKFKDMGCVVMGKSERGVVELGDELLIEPNGTKVKVSMLQRDDEDVEAARPGENLRMRLTGIDDEDVQAGFVLCPVTEPVHVAKEFECTLVLVDLLEHKSVFTAGYKAILHVHTVTEECEVTKIVAKFEAPPKGSPKGTQPSKVPCKFAKTGAKLVCRIRLERATCLERFDDVAQMGRFTIRDEGKTIAIGKITKLPKK